MFLQGGPIDNWSHVTGSFEQSSAESEYHSACTGGMALSHFRIVKKEILSNNTYVFTKQAPLIILDSNSDVCMENNGKDTKHNR